MSNKISHNHRRANICLNYHNLIANCQRGDASVDTGGPVDKRIETIS